MNFRNTISKYLISLVTFMFLFTGAGCSNSNNANSAEQQKTTTTTQEQKQTTVNKAEEVQSPIKLEKVTVSRVVDGDTVELSNGSKVRFIGINTPESTTKTEPYGKEASNYTKSQLTGKTVYLEEDVSETDKYGRLLGYVWLEQPKEINDNEIKTNMYNAILALNGYAEQSTYPPDVKYADYFRKFAAEARENNRGLWAINHNGTTKGDGITPSESNSSSNSTSSSSNTNATVQQATAPQTAQSNNQGVTIYITKTGEKYHAAGCRYLSKSQIPISLDDAKARGYDACSVCHPPQ